MNKSDKDILIGVGALIAIGGGIWYLYKKKKERQQNLDYSVGGKPDFNIGFTSIQIGERSYRAKVIQRYINTACRIGVDLTGVYDEITQELSRKCAGFPREGDIDEDSYTRAFRTLEVAGLLPDKE